jgi:hypothetical protein
LTEQSLKEIDSKEESANLSEDTNLKYEPTPNASVKESFSDSSSITEPSAHHSKITLPPRRPIFSKLFLFARVEKLGMPVKDE